MQVRDGADLITRLWQNVLSR